MLDLELHFIQCKKKESKLPEEHGTTDEFEYNDGLGDLLREKEQLKFSWVKTSAVLVSLLVIIGFGFWLTTSAPNNRQADDFQREEFEPHVTKRSHKDDVQAIEKPTQKTVSIPTVKQSEPEVSKPVKPHPAPKVVETKPIQNVTPKTKPAPADSVHYRVIAGTFSNYQNAENQKQNLALKKIDSFIWSRDSQHIVQAGSFNTREQAQAMVSKLKKTGIDSYIITSN